MKRFLVSALLICLAFSQPASASLPLAGCEIGKAASYCPIEHCGDCHMNPTTATGHAQEAIQVASAKISLSQSVLRFDSEVISVETGTDQSEKDTANNPSESPGKLYDLYSDYRI